MRALTVGTVLLASLAQVQAATLPKSPAQPRASLPNDTSSCLTLTPANVQSQGGCAHSPTSRQCWGDYSINTNWYDDTPYTGVTREYWLVAQNVTMAPDVSKLVLLAFGPPCIWN